MELIKTYVENLDDEMGGGIPKGHVVLISGTPGSMKSSLILSIMYNNMKKNNLKSLYLSIEENKESLDMCMSRLGMGDVDEKKLSIVDIGRLRIEHSEADEAKDWLKILKEYIIRRIKEERFDILAIDSLTALYSLTELRHPRKELFHFFGFLKSLKITTLLISEIAGSSQDGMLGLFKEDYLADGIILLKLHEVGDTDIQLRIRCVKMRHQKHYHGYQALIYRDGKFMATPVISD